MLLSTHCLPVCTHASSATEKPRPSLWQCTQVICPRKYDKWQRFKACRLGGEGRGEGGGGERGEGWGGEGGREGREGRGGGGEGGGVHLQIE